MKVFLVLAAVVAAAYAASHEHEHLGSLGHIHLDPQLRYIHSSDEQERYFDYKTLYQQGDIHLDPQLRYIHSSDEEERYYYDPHSSASFSSGEASFHQQGVKSSSSSSEEKPIDHARWFPYDRSALKSSSSSEERPIVHGINPIEHHRVVRDLLAHSKVSSSSSSSEEEKPINQARAWYRSGLKSSSSSSEEKPIDQARWLPHDRSALKSSSSSEERPIVHYGINPIEHHRIVRDVSSSSEEQQHGATWYRVGRPRQTSSRERAALDEFHKDQDNQRMWMDGVSRAAIPPTVLEGTYHVAYDPPTVVQAPIIA